MKRITGSILAVCLVVANSTTAHAERSTKVGKGISKAGRTLPVTLNTVLNGVGTPSNFLGHDGDFYLDRKTWRFFGPKTKGHWPLPVLLVGPTGNQGTPGEAGPIGPPGKAGLKGEGGSSGQATVTAGSAGPIGPSGPAGAPGAMGPAGASGPSGGTGPAGSSGPPGATGATGSPGLPGPTGTSGAVGARGLQGDTGLTGVTGATGTVGPRGPSRTISGSLGFPSPISGAAGSTANTNPFGNFAAGTNYSVLVVVEVWTPLNPFASPLVSLNASSTFGTPQLSLWQNSSVGLKLVGGPTLSSTIIQAHVSVDGSGVTGVFSLVITVTDRDGTVAAPASLDGYYVATEVETLA